MKVKEESETVGLKLNIQKTDIMASGTKKAHSKQAANICFCLTNILILNL